MSSSRGRPMDGAARFVVREARADGRLVTRGSPGVDAWPLEGQRRETTVARVGRYSRQRAPDLRSRASLSRALGWDGRGP